MGNQQYLYFAAVALIAGSVMLMLGTIKVEGQEAAIDAVQYRAARARILDLVQIMERDFRNVGSFMYFNGTHFVGKKPKLLVNNIVKEYTKGAVNVFEFMAQTDPEKEPELVRYTWEEKKDQVVKLNNKSERTLYVVERRVGPAGTLTFRSEGLITDFDISIDRDGPLDQDLNTIGVLGDLDDTRRIKLRMAAISPLGKGDSVEETRFDAVFRPIAMTITQ